MPRKDKTSLTSLLRKITFLLAGLGVGVGHHIKEGEKTSSHTIEESKIQCYFSPKGGCEQAIIDAIDSARKEIHIYIFSFTLESIAKALKRAQERNVKVYIIADKTQAKGQGSQIPKISAWLHDLFIDKQKGVGHHKLVIIDRKFVIFGSFNYSKSAQNVNREAIVRINDEKIAIKFYKEWLRQKAQEKVHAYKAKK
ncbi:MAG: phospholipase D-like domain-containing protein [Bacteroidota bacterium]